MNDGARWYVPVMGVDLGWVVEGVEGFGVEGFGVVDGAGAVLAGFPGVTRGALDAGPVQLAPVGKVSDTWPPPAGAVEPTAPDGTAVLDVEGLCSTFVQSRYAATVPPTTQAHTGRPCHWRVSDEPPERRAGGADGAPAGLGAGGASVWGRVLTRTSPYGLR